MTMKLSRRDKVIFIVVLVLVVIGVGIWLFLKPQYENLQASEDRLVAKQGERDQLQAKIDTLPDLKKTLEENVNKVVEAQKDFVSERDIHDTQQISTYVMDMLEPSGIEITGMNLQDLSAMSIEEYLYNKRALAYPMKISGDLARKLPAEVYYAYENNYPEAGPAATISGTIVTVSYTCDLDFQQLYDAIQIVADHDKNIYLETASASVDIEMTENGAEVVPEGQMVITFYEIYPMDPADLDD